MIATLRRSVEGWSNGTECSPQICGVAVSKQGQIFFTNKTKPDSSHFDIIDPFWEMVRPDNKATFCSLILQGVYKNHYNFKQT